MSDGSSKRKRERAVQKVKEESAIHQKKVPLALKVVPNERERERSQIRPIVARRKWKWRFVVRAVLYSHLLFSEEKKEEEEEEAPLSEDCLFLLPAGFWGTHTHTHTHSPGKRLWQRTVSRFS